MSVVFAEVYAQYIADNWGFADVEAAVLSISAWMHATRWAGYGVDIDSWLVTGHSNGGMRSIRAQQTSEGHTKPTKAKAHGMLPHIARTRSLLLPLSLDIRRFKVGYPALVFRV